LAVIPAEPGFLGRPKYQKARQSGHLPSEAAIISYEFEATSATVI
jgi:hypothetical protein